MNKILLIIEREFLQRVKKRSFLITTILVPLLLGIGMIALIKITLTTKERHYVAVYDETNYFNDKIKDSDAVIFKSITPNELKKDSLKQVYIELGYDGVLCIPAIDGDRKPNITYYSETPLGIKSTIFINQELTAIYRTLLLTQKGLDEEFINKLDRKIEISEVVKGEEVEGIAEVASMLGYIIGFVMYFFLAIYGTIVMRGVMEEKTSRIVEIMISLVKPFQLMMGKIVGIGLVGFAQFLIWFVLLWIISFGIGFLFGSGMEAFQNNLASDSTSTINSQEVALKLFDSLNSINFIRLGLSLLFYFFFGYIFYASQYAAIGAASTEDTDLQTLALPVTFPIIISFVMMITVVDEPFSKLAVILSYIPFTSPIIMMSRLPFEISIIEQIISMLILFFSSILMVWISAKIYKTGILIQGKKVTLKEIATWFFYKN
jgi:ABC-2 type transport system permease protein